MKRRAFVEGISSVTIDLRRTTRLRTENTTWRMDREEFLSHSQSSGHAEHALPRDSSTRGAHVIAVGQVTESSQRLCYPTPFHRNFFLPAPSEPIDSRHSFCEELLDAMTMGVGDYFEKTGAFSQIGVALSGGRDSLLCLLVAHRYVSRKYRLQGPEIVASKVAEMLRAFFMPTRYSSAATRAAAETAATELGIPFTILSIEEAFEREVEATRNMLHPGEVLTPLTVQNIQARLRAERMWNWSNAVGGLFLQTGNMSEKAAGYTTIGGDLMGCLAVIANLPKTVVNYLLDYLLETEKLVGIAATIAIPASAELAPNQQDERDLMPFRCSMPALRCMPPKSSTRQSWRTCSSTCFQSWKQPSCVPGRTSLPDCLRARFTSGCRRRCRCIWATWISSESDPCSSPW
jgi:NAD+ synthase (glutamine-hydrolysing)